MEAPTVKLVVYAAPPGDNRMDMDTPKKAGQIACIIATSSGDQGVCNRVIGEAEIWYCGSCYYIGLYIVLHTPNKQVANQNGDSILPPLYS